MKNLFRILVVSMLAVFVSGSAALAASNSLDLGWNGGNKRSEQKGNKVAFYIQINGEQLDSAGSISAHDKSFYTEALYTSTLNQSLSSSFSIAIGNGVTEADILKYISSVPSESYAFSSVVKQYKDKDAYICSSNGKVIPWSKLTSDSYKVQWYVLKYEIDGMWHVDGVIIERETDKEISIVVPSEDAERATCVEYDAVKGTFTPGVMSVKPNRPHSYNDGDNDTLIVEGFEDVWYTVLDENTFKANSYVVPQELMDAATAVSKLADARLSELDEKLQRQYGRIDSQAYKQEYISRKGGKTLYVTPFITEKLSARHSVDKDEYIWLAMGDGHGNILKVYIMDREAANIDNMFDDE